MSDELETFRERMQEVFYTQAEADALIAGALHGIADKWRAEVKECCPVLLEKELLPANMFYETHRQCCQKLTDAKFLLSFTPDAARLKCTALALEEREKRMAAGILDILDKWQRGSPSHPTTLANLIETLDKILEADLRTTIEFQNEISSLKAEFREREAKLIADTRLEEAEWWNQRQPLWSDAMSKEKRARLAAHRAAVQPGG